MDALFVLWVLLRRECRFQVRRLQILRLRAGARSLSSEPGGFGSGQL
jgi:hypothetical protein